MNRFISTPEDVARLLAEADLWIGTPYAPDGSVRGTGCSCSRLPYVVLLATGMEQLPEPPRRGQMRKNQILPAMLEYFAANEGLHFEKVSGLEQVECGDVLLFDAGIGHLGLALGDGRVIHSWQNQGVHYTTIITSNYAKRFVGAWRPVVAS